MSGTPRRACTLAPAAAADRARRWREIVGRGAPVVSRTADSVEARWLLDRGAADELEALVSAERECCAFAAWTIRRRGADTTLRITVEHDGELAAALFAALTGLSVPPGR
jgi:hypothetical protein